ncbi:type II secretion system F family protein [Candidatus Margulisiibacteriota bacterium]
MIKRLLYAHHEHFGGHFSLEEHSLFRFVQQFLPLPLEKALWHYIHITHLNATPAFLVLIFLFYYLISSSVVYFLTYHIVLSIFSGCTLLVVPFIHIMIVVRMRKKLIHTDVAELSLQLASILKSGITLHQAIEIISREFSGPFKYEFETIHNELQFGLPLEKTLKNSASRISFKDYDLLITLLLVSHSLGAKLSPLLERVATTLRNRHQLSKEIQSLSAQGKLSGFIIVILPIILTFLILTVNPAYFLSFFTTQLGIVLLSTTFALELIGIYAIYKIITVEF